MNDSEYTRRLFSTCDIEKINTLSYKIFKEGQLELIDDLIVDLLPLANIIYYKYVKSLDDYEYAKDDLISDAITILYRDMKYRWDKYIKVDFYSEYYSTSFKNIMLSLVHGYHNYYLTNDVDPEFMNSGIPDENHFENVEYELLKTSVREQMISFAKRVLSCRHVNKNLLLSIFEYKYIEHQDLEALMSRVRVLGLSKNLFNFYVEHVDYVYRLSYNLQYAVLRGNQKMIDRISEKLSRFEDATYRSLVSAYYDTVIPEIYAEFGEEVAAKFVKTFSNRTIHVPAYRDFCDTLLGGAVVTLAQGDKENLYDVASDYNIPYRTLSRIYNKAINNDKE